MRLVTSTAISACIFLPILALGAQAAHAVEPGPVAGCPTGFFLNIAETIGSDFDRNGDGYICLKPGSHHGVRIDNLVPER